MSPDNQPAKGCQAYFTCLSAFSHPRRRLAGSYAAVIPILSPTSEFRRPRPALYHSRASAGSRFPSGAGCSGRHDLSRRHHGLPLAGRVHRFGWIGVDLFFVLSGYLIGGQLLAETARGQEVNLRRFFARRALRILPACFVVLAIYAFLPSWREYPEMFPLWKFLLSARNIGLRGGTAFSHAWSLAVEDQFWWRNSSSA